MGAAPAFTSVSEAMDMVQAGLSYLAAADAAQLPAASQAECLRGLERAGSVLTAARASMLAGFTAGQGYARKTEIDNDREPDRGTAGSGGQLRSAALASVRLRPAVFGGRQPGVEARGSPAAA